MTAHTMNKDRENCINAGMNDYISKPVEPKDLEKLIKKWALNIGKSSKVKESKVKTQDIADIFNRTTLLSRLGGDEEFLNKIVNIFIEDTPSHIDMLKESLENNDSVTSRIQAHSIKGSSGTICANAMQQVAIQLEDAISSGDPEHLNTLLDKIEFEFGRLKNVLTQQE